MKKPQITKGEWIHKYSIWVESKEQPKGIVACTANTDVKDEIKTANAQAISAVPEMIDALIKAYKAMDRIPLEFRTLQDHDTKDRIYYALKKAGVEL